MFKTVVSMCVFYTVLLSVVFVDISFYWLNESGHKVTKPFRLGKKNRKAPATAAAGCLCGFVSGNYLKIC